MKKYNKVLSLLLALPNAIIACAIFFVLWLVYSIFLFR